MAAKKKTTRSSPKQQAAAGAWPECQVDGCDEPVHLRGLCEKHWTAGEGK